MMPGTIGKGPERLETARLRLVRPRPADAPRIFDRYAADPRVTRYVSWPRHASVAETERFLEWAGDEWERWPAGAYLIESREDGTLLGSTGLGFETATRAFTGYVLAVDAWGRGYAVEALSAMVGLARAVGVVRLYALCHHEHRASARVLEKGGFACEGCLRRHTVFPNLEPGRAEDVLCYARILGGADSDEA